MIEQLRVQNYRCLKDVTVDLTPVHAFIGPNDSGKSSLLRALRNVVQLAGGMFPGPDEPFPPFWTEPGSDGVRFTVNLQNGRAYVVEGEGGGIRETISPGVGGAASSATSRSLARPSHLNHEIDLGLRRVRMVRLDADSLRRESALIPNAGSFGFLDDRGSGLAGVIQALLGRGDDSFQALKNEFLELFPSAGRVGVRAASSSTVELSAATRDGTEVGPEQMSEGMLYYLGYAVLPHLSPTSLLLVEEPENGLHPSRIAEVVSILRSVAETTNTQVIMATHSPLVINELKSEEVSLVTRPGPDYETVVTPMTQTKNFEKRSRVYALGELWLSYADGDTEKDLVEGGDEPVSDVG